MASSPQELLMVERKAFSRSVFSEDEELKCLSDQSEFLEQDLLADEEDFARPYARSLAFVARKRRNQKQQLIKTAKAQDPLPALTPKTSEELCSPASPTGICVTKSERLSWADVQDNSGEEDCCEQTGSYATHQSANERLPAHGATNGSLWQAEATLNCEGPSSRTMQPMPAKESEAEAPGLAWDPIGAPEESVELISDDVLSKLSVGRSHMERNSGIKLFGKWSCSTTASSACDEFEELLEEKPPPLWPSMGRPSACQQPPMANPGASHQTPVAANASTCMWYGAVPVAAIAVPVALAPCAPVQAAGMWQHHAAPQLASCGKPVIPMPYPAAQSAGMWQHREAPQQTSCGRPVIPLPSPAARGVGMWQHIRTPQQESCRRPVIPVPYPADHATGTWHQHKGEAPQQESCGRVVLRSHGHSWEDAAEEQRRWDVVLETGLTSSLSLGGGPCFGKLHRFHRSMASMGVVSSDFRSFTKTQNKNRLSIACEDKIHERGVARYAVQFTSGELSNADGVGFILSGVLPCTRNIQSIVSLFVNRTGRICVRMKQDVERISARVKAIELGDWLEVIADLEQKMLTFVVWPQAGGEPSAVTVGLQKLVAKAAQRLPCGHLAVVVKHVGVSVTLAS